MSLLRRTKDELLVLFERNNIEMVICSEIQQKGSLILTNTEFVTNLDNKSK